MYQNYKLVINPKLKPDIETFLEENRIKYEVDCKHNNQYCTIKIPSNTNNDDIIKVNDFLVKCHYIESDLSFQDIKEPRVAVSIKVHSFHRGLFLDYLLSQVFCEVLKKGKIAFSPCQIIVGAFRTLDSIPLWITEKDIKKVENAVKKSILKGHSIETVIRSIVKLTDLTEN